LASFAIGTFDCQSCPKGLRGISDGDTIVTTIVSADEAALVSARSGADATPSCGDLGDLPPGAVLTSSASVVDDQGAESCFEVLTVTPRTLSTGTVTPMSSGATLLLPDGCTGRIDVYFQSPNDTSSFLDSDPGDGGQAAWWLVRRFQVTGDPSLCFSTSLAPATCVDAFIAENVRR
jgi:hypothetical protein